MPYHKSEIRTYVSDLKSSHSECWNHKCCTWLTALCSDKIRSTRVIVLHDLEKHHCIIDLRLVIRCWVWPRFIIHCWGWPRFIILHRIHSHIQTLTRTSAKQYLHLHPSSTLLVYCSGRRGWCFACLHPACCSVIYWYMYKYCWYWCMIIPIFTW